MEDGEEGRKEQLGDQAEGPLHCEDASVRAVLMERDKGWKHNKIDKIWHGQQHDVTANQPLQRSTDVVPFSLKKNRASENSCTERLPHLLPVHHHPLAWGARWVQKASALAGCHRNGRHLGFHSPVVV